jgi:ribosome-associated protein YbcJ (S4-like RNA binding protein)
MPNLVITKEGQAVGEYLIEDENTVIGRAHECDITVPDESVSRRHLRIICILGDCFLEDLNSANGTLVNNRLTKKCPLEDGDTISIGQHEIVYNAAMQQGSSEEEFDRARVKLIQQLDQDEATPEEADADSGEAGTDTGIPTAETSHEDILDTTVVTKQADATIPAPSQQTAQSAEPGPEIGSEPASQAGIVSRTKAENPKERIGILRIISGKREGHNMAMSKSVTGIDKSGQRVAAITRRPDGYFLVPLGDGGSDNVTVSVNGNEISRKIYPLWSNDIIELDGTEMEFMLENDT